MLFQSSSVSTQNPINLNIVVCLENSECERLQEKEVVHFETPELINFHTAVFVWFVMPLVTSSFITVLF